ncbi:MAG: glycosyltransferase, partial [Bacteroidales bacterium]|nr:glycosyltransferase [Bacteroidales bacterium]
MTAKPLISVVMATFNEPPEYITQSVRSILDQTLGDFELLLIDDSTNPDTIA